MCLTSYVLSDELSLIRSLTVSVLLYNVVTVREERRGASEGEVKARRVAANLTVQCRLHSHSHCIVPCKLNVNAEG